MENLTTEYINVLDKWQREVDEIRQFHHVVWEKTQQNDVIIQHRTGSRVEKQTRIVGYGKKTNIDFMFEVNGLDVSNDRTNGGIYLKSEENSESSLFGRVYFTAKAKDELQTNVRYSDIFSDDVFQWDEVENAFLVKPPAFRDKVMDQSGFAYKRNADISKKSPSVAGKGIVNKYDAVPCLRLQNWPREASAWLKEGNVFGIDWKKGIIFDNIAIFLVPTGNPGSLRCEDEFRLSFSIPEIECFNKMNDHTRKLFGLTKFVFQSLFATIDVLKWFHVKHLLLNMVDMTNYGDDVGSISPLQFVLEALREVGRSIKQRSISLFFMPDSNIFPTRKLTEQSEVQYNDIFAHIGTKVSDLLEKHLQSELKITESKDWLESAKSTLEKKAEEGGNVFLDEYVNGYLTRLLSVITFPLCRNDTDDNKKKDIKKIQDTFLRYKENKHIIRIVPMVDASIRRIAGDQSLDVLFGIQHGTSLVDGDRLSIHAHHVFEKVIGDQSLVSVPKYVSEESLDIEKFTGYEIGVSVTRHHKDLLLPMDTPLLQVMSTLTEMYGSCPRFYVHPSLLLQHYQVVHHIKYHQNKDSGGETHSILLNLLDSLLRIALKLPSTGPYYGKLSYRFTAMHLLTGYVVLLKECDIHYEFDFDLESEIKSFTLPKDCGSFDLK